jgi:hypothetical protein
MRQASPVGQLAECQASAAMPRASPSTVEGEFRLLLLLLVALILAWPTYGLSLVAWVLLSLIRAAARRAAIERRQDLRAQIEPLFEQRLDEFFLALDVRMSSRHEVTNQEATQCGRHILNYLAHNPGEAALFMKGVEQEARRFGGRKPDPVLAARREVMDDAKAEIHLSCGRAIVAVATHNPSLQCFRNIHLDLLQRDLKKIEASLRAREHDPEWVHVMRDWLTHETEQGFPKDGTSTSMSKITVICWVRNFSHIHIPGEIVHLTNLEELVAINQELQSLPAAIGKLERLRELCVIACKLESLPREIGCLESLKILDINDNPIARLPDEITRLQRLEKLDLSDTPNLQLTDAQSRWIDDLIARGCDVKRVQDAQTPPVESGTGLFASDLPF